MLCVKSVKDQPNSKGDSFTQQSTAIKDEYLYFGPIGREAYASYGPESPNQHDYAIKMIQASFVNTEALEARKILWKNFDILIAHMENTTTVKTVDLVSDLTSFISRIRTRSSEIPPENPWPLDIHLNNVLEFCQRFFLNDNGISRIPDLLCDRYAQILTYVVAPLHDILKYLGNELSQVVPDHQILLAEICKRYFTGRSVVINGALSTLSEDDVEFMGNIIGDHENIFKELGRDMFFSSRDKIKITKALFSLADTLAGSLKENEPNSGVWIIDDIALNERFTDLCFRHMDLEKGKVFRPNWIPCAIRELIRTFDHLRDFGYKFFDSRTDKKAEIALIEAGLTSIERAFQHDDQRRLNSTTHATKVFNGPQQKEILKTQTNLFYLLHYCS